MISVNEDFNKSWLYDNSKTLVKNFMYDYDHIFDNEFNLSYYNDNRTAYINYIKKYYDGFSVGLLEREFTPLFYNTIRPICDNINTELSSFDVVKFRSSLSHENDLEVYFLKTYSKYLQTYKTINAGEITQEYNTINLNIVVCSRNLVFEFYYETNEEDLELNEIGIYKDLEILSNNILRCDNDENKFDGNTKLIDNTITALIMNGVKVKQHDIFKDTTLYNNIFKTESDKNVV